MDRLKGQHKNYAETGTVPGQGTIGGVESFGAAQHNHRDGYSHNDGKHRQPKGMRDGVRAPRSKALDFHRNPNSPDHGPF